MASVASNWDSDRKVYAAFRPFEVNQPGKGKTKTHINAEATSLLGFKGARSRHFPFGAIDFC